MVIVRMMDMLMGRLTCSSLRVRETDVPSPSSPSVPVYHPMPSARSGGDQLVTTESRSPCLAISHKAIRAKGPII